MLFVLVRAFNKDRRKVTTELESITLPAHLSTSCISRKLESSRKWFCTENCTGSAVSLPQHGFSIPEAWELGSYCGLGAIPKKHFQSNCLFFTTISAVLSQLTSALGRNMGYIWYHCLIARSTVIHAAVCHLITVPTSVHQTVWIYFISGSRRTCVAQLSASKITLMLNF